MSSSGVGSTYRKFKTGLGAHAVGSRRSIAICKDAAAYNQCIIANEQRSIIVSRSAGGDDRLWDCDCRQHQACLSNKPIVHSTPQLSGTLVKLGHLLEFSKAMEDLNSKLDELVDENFHYREVLAFPADVLEWQQEAKRILDVSAVALDLSEDTRGRIRAVDNGNWAIGVFPIGILSGMIVAPVVDRSKKRRRR